MMAALVSTIDDWIRNYFSEKAIIDDRMENPLTTISIPNTGLVHLIASSSLFSNNNTDDEEVLAFEIYAPNMTAWYQMGFVRKHTRNYNTLLNWLFSQFSVLVLTFFVSRPYYHPFLCILNFF